MENSATEEMIPKDDYLRILDVLNSDGTAWDKIEGVRSVLLECDLDCDTTGFENRI